MKATEGFDQESTGRNFFRCTMCGTVVSEWDIKEHKGCKKCANPRIKPTNLSLFEKVQQIILHPMVWRW
jgi:NAD-dependent SIR2 family protein deacetylase